MKKFLSLALAILTICASIAMTVSAADHTDETEIETETVSVEMIRPEEAMEIISERLGYEPFYVVIPWGPNYWGLELTVSHLEDRLWGIRVEGDEWQMSLDAFEEALARFEKQGFFDVPMVRGNEYERYSSYVIYGEVVDCEWLPMALGDTVVEIFSDVESEEFLSIVEVSELFYEEFGYEVHIYECGTPYFDAFCINDSGDEYLIPVKEEGLPVEVWEAFADEFGNEFGVKAVYTELAVKQYFHAHLGYRPEVEIFSWSEEEATMQLSFKHLGGKKYTLDAVYDEFFGWTVPIEELKEFAENHPECLVVPSFTWKQLMAMMEFYYNW